MYSEKKASEVGATEPYNNNIQHRHEGPDVIGTDYDFKHKVQWMNVTLFLILHFLALWGLSLIYTGPCLWPTVMWGYFTAYIGGEGITIGAHRYYTHRSFKATPPLRFCLLVLQTLAGQNSMYTWVRDHRVHHKFSDTDADPHNAQRGLFFSHIGWLMCKKHPYVKEYGKKIDMRDLEADWMVMFQKKYFLYVYTIIAIIIPVGVPVYFWNENWFTAIMLCFFSRYVIDLNSTWTVNSLAHFYGTRPYDRKLLPCESWFVSLITSGEGWHNYHHAFPWDYNCAELSMRFNQSGKIIRFLERIGWAYDLKSVSSDMIEKRIMRTGDGSHEKLGTEEGRAAVTAFGPVHPLNPTFTTTMKPGYTTLKSEGYALYEDEKLHQRTPNKGWSLLPEFWEVFSQ